MAASTMKSGVRKSGWPMPRLMMSRPCAASALARASTAKAFSSPIRSNASMVLSMGLSSERLTCGPISPAVQPIRSGNANRAFNFHVMAGLVPAIPIREAVCLQAGRPAHRCEARRPLDGRGRTRQQLALCNKIGCEVFEARASAQLHGANEFVAEMIEHAGHALRAADGQSPDHRPADQHRTGAERKRLEDIGAAPDAAIDVNLGLAFKRRGNLPDHGR